PTYNNTDTATQIIPHRCLLKQVRYHEVLRCSTHFQKPDTAVSLSFSFSLLISLAFFLLSFPLFFLHSLSFKDNSNKTSSFEYYNNSFISMSFHVLPDISLFSIFLSLFSLSHSLLSSLSLLSPFSFSSHLSPLSISPISSLLSLFSPLFPSYLTSLLSLSLPSPLSSLSSLLYLSSLSLSLSPSLPLS